jgi:gamma-glutamyltranspeptidase/glutathione hydrolase
MGTAGGVSSEHPLASVAGQKILLEGGNAFDAAVATSLTLSVTQPSLGSLGSDLFALLYDASSGKVHCVNASGWAPKGLSLETLRSEGRSSIPEGSPHAVVVPGMIDGLNKIQQKLCTFEFGRLAEDSIRIAEKGFPTSLGLHRAIQHDVSRLTEQLAKQLFFKGGQPLAPGEMLVQKSLAETLRSVASEPRAFYEGRVPERICEYLEAKGGVHDVEDFAGYEAEWVEPLRTTYRGMDVYEVPPNSQGATTLIILNVLENFGVAELGAFSGRRVHLFVEAAKKAYADKNLYLGDPRFVKIPLRKLLSKTRAKELAGSIKFGEMSVGGPLRPGDTTNFVVFDRWGNVVSAIQSLYYGFGSALMESKTGVVLNCRGTHFTSTGANRLEPRKRPLHTLSSVIATSQEGEVLAFGASGGDYRPQQHVLLLTNVVDYGMNLQEAVDAPRFLWDGGKKVIAEEGFKGHRGLENLGYDLARQKHPGGTGVAHCGARKGKVAVLSADVRGDGVAVGPNT